MHASANNLLGAGTLVTTASWYRGRRLFSCRYFDLSNFLFLFFCSIMQILFWMYVRFISGFRIPVPTDILLWMFLLFHLNFVFALSTFSSYSGNRQLASSGKGGESGPVSFQLTVLSVYYCIETTLNAFVSKFVFFKFFYFNVYWLYPIPKMVACL